MNLNVRVKGQHVDFEEKTYYASFSGELEASASPMWALVSHLKDSTTRDFTLNVLKHCLTAIREWMVDVEFDSFDKVGAVGRLQLEPPHPGLTHKLAPTKLGNFFGETSKRGRMQEESRTFQDETRPPKKYRLRNMRIE